MIKLYLDEDVHEDIATALRLRGYSEFIKKGIEHGGIILSKQLPIGTIIKALLKLLSNIKSENFKNSILWLSDWIN